MRKLKRAGGWSHWWTQPTKSGAPTRCNEVVMIWPGGRLLSLSVMLTSMWARHWLAFRAWASASGNLRSSSRNGYGTLVWILKQQIVAWDPLNSPSHGKSYKHGYTSACGILCVLAHNMHTEFINHSDNEMEIRNNIEITTTTYRISCGIALEGRWQDHTALMRLCSNVARCADACGPQQLFMANSHQNERKRESNIEAHRENNQERESHRGSPLAPTPNQCIIVWLRHYVHGWCMSNVFTHVHRGWDNGQSQFPGHLLPWGRPGRHARCCLAILMEAA